MTRYGRIGFNEAMSMSPWYRTQYCEALAELLEEENALSHDKLDP